MERSDFSSEMTLSVRNLSVAITASTIPLMPVRNVSFDIEKGSTHCIVGESGSGKSMTAYSIMGLLPASARSRADRVLFQGREISLGQSTRLRIHRPGMAMIFQEPMTALNPAFTIGTQLMDVCRAHQRLSAADARGAVRQLLERVGLTPADERMSQFPHQMSGGQRQRVLIAMALLCKPTLLIADEPTTALDVTVQAGVLRLIKSLQVEFGLAMLFITHDIGLVSRIADRVSVMYAGEIVETGTVTQVLGSPAHPYTAALLASIPGPDQTRLPYIRGSIPSLANRLDGCGFRDRCGHSGPACLEPPPFQIANSGQEYRCIREVA